MFGSSKRDHTWASALAALLAFSACSKTSDDEPHPTQPVQCGATCSSQVSITVTLPVPLTELAGKTVTACRNVDTCFSAQLGDSVELGQSIDFGTVNGPAQVDITGTPHNLKLRLSWQVTLAEAQDGDHYAVRFGDDLVVIDQRVTYNQFDICSSTCRQALLDTTPPSVPEQSEAGSAAGAAGAGGAP